MSAHRFLFFAPRLAEGDPSVELDGGEHHHLAKSLRLGPGDDAHVTNGRGLLTRCTVRRVEGARTRLDVADVVENEPEGRRVALALALLRKDRFAQAFEQCVELGITDCVPFVAEKSHLRRVGAGFVDRLERVAVAAMKQSFRCRLPTVRAPVSFDDLVASCGEYDRVVLAEQGAPAVRTGEGSILGVVGPEAGLTDDERVALEAAGAVAVSVSTHRLRSETAATALIAALGLSD